MIANQGNFSELSLYSLIINGPQKDDNIAIKGIDRTPLNYKGLKNQMIYTVSRLNAMGYGRNDRILLILPDGPELTVAFLSVAAGCTCMPLSPTMPASEYDFYFTAIKPVAAVFLTGSDSPAIKIAQFNHIPILWLEPQFDEAAGTFRLSGDHGPGTAIKGYSEPTDLALILSTSGTTSKPKIVLYTQNRICTYSVSLIFSHLLDKNDSLLKIVTLHHTFGSVISLASIIVGASVICTPGFNPYKFSNWIHEFEPTWYAGTPAIHRQVIETLKKDNDKRPLRLKFILSSAAPIPKNEELELENITNTPVINVYGMTETFISQEPLPPGVRKDGAAGIAVLNNIAIMDEEGVLQKPNEKGEIVVNGPAMFIGYENNTEANKQCFINGWFRTGDIGYLDEDGYIFVTGRKKELINVGGEKITPYKVEEVLMNHPMICEVAAFPIPNPRLGEVVGAAVVLKDNCVITSDEVRRFAAAHLQFNEVPSQVLIVKEIPKKGVVKKVRRNELYHDLMLNEK